MLLPLVLVLPEGGGGTAAAAGTQGDERASHVGAAADAACRTGADTAGTIGSTGAGCNAIADGSAAAGTPGAGCAATVGSAGAAGALALLTLLAALVARALLLAQPPGTASAGTAFAAGMWQC